MRDTYNLDAASPRTMNRKSSHIICGEARESKSLMDCCFLNTHSVLLESDVLRRMLYKQLTLILLFLICNADHLFSAQTDCRFVDFYLQNLTSILLFCPHNNALRAIFSEAVSLVMLQRGEFKKFAHSYKNPLCSKE